MNLEAPLFMLACCCFWGAMPVVLCSADIAVKSITLPLVLYTVASLRLQILRLYAADIILHVVFWCI